MLTVTDDYKTAINASSREFRVRVSVYFDGDGSAATVFDQDDIISLELMEESSDGSIKPAGSVSSNELQLVFDNTTRAFTPTNPTGTYYGKLHPGTLVVAELALKTDDDPETWEYVALGTFRTSDWSAPSDSVEASVTCYDRLKDLGNISVPLIPTQQNISYGMMFRLLFTALGLTPAEYNIDASLTTLIRAGWFPAGTVFDALRNLAEAANAVVYVDRNNVIQVRSCASVDAYIVEMTDTNQIIKADNPQQYADIYSSVNIQYKTISVKPMDTILEINDLEIPAGGMTLTGLQFNDTPVIYCDYAQITGAVNSSVSAFAWGAWGCDITFANSGATTETVSVVVRGRAFEALSAAYVAEDATTKALIGTRTLKVDNQFIQSLSYATSYATKLLQAVTDTSPKVETSIRGNPVVELKDTIRVNDETSLITDLDIVPYQIKLSYDGGLTGQIIGRKASTLEVV